MKKTTGIISLFMILAIALSGCGSSTQSSNQQTASAPSTTAGARQGQFARADVMGEVSSVSGSDITLKLIEMPDFRPGNRQGNNNQNNKTQGDNGQGNQKGPGQNGGQPRQRTLKYTGETKTVTIPADTSITTFSRGKNGQETKTVELKDIKQGDILQIWYSDKEKGTISRVSLMPSRTPQNPQ